MKIIAYTQVACQKLTYHARIQNTQGIQQYIYFLQKYSQLVRLVGWENLTFSNSRIAHI